VAVLWLCICRLLTNSLSRSSAQLSNDGILPHPDNILMSTSNQTHNASSSKLTPIFQTAYDEYKRLTGRDLNTHPFSAQLDRCSSPDDISNVLREKAQELTRSREGDDKLLEWLNPIVHVLSTFSAMLGEGLVSIFIRVPFCIIVSQLPLSVILAREDHLYWFWCSSRGRLPSMITRSASL